jgi:hypothetical protein
MSSEEITYAFCIENLRYIYKMIGYDNLLKEVEFIHHISQPRVANVTKKPDRNVADTDIVSILKDEIVASPVEAISEEPSVEVVSIEPVIDGASTKNVVINNSVKTRYVRAPIMDDIRCEATKIDGSRCTLKRADDCKYCSRHLKAMSK